MSTNIPTVQRIKGSLAKNYLPSFFWETVGVGLPGMKRLMQDPVAEGSLQYRLMTRKLPVINSQLAELLRRKEARERLAEAVK